MGHYPLAGGEDFVPIAAELEFTATTPVQCFSVNIINDSVVEDTEIFHVAASSNDPVSFVNSPVTVSILDNQDRKFFK